MVTSWWLRGKFCLMLYFSYFVIVMHMCDWLIYLFNFLLVKFCILATKESRAQILSLFFNLLENKFQHFEIWGENFHISTRFFWFKGIFSSIFLLSGWFSRNTWSISAKHFFVCLLMMPHKNFGMCIMMVFLFAF